MNRLDIHALARRLRTIESIAILPRARSTNLLGSRVIAECIGNEISLPTAIIIAREQTEGRGRNGRTWHSPPEAGIYSTTLVTRTPDMLMQVPLETGVAVAAFLRDTYNLDARVKWPNDVLIGGEKIAGSLIEARTHEGSVYVLIGIGINVTTTAEPRVDNATSIARSLGKTVELDTVTERFIEHFDRRLTDVVGSESIFSEWRGISAHREGDPVSCRVGERTISGRWSGIDEFGRALIADGNEVVPISSGELIVHHV